MLTNKNKTTLLGILFIIMIIVVYFVKIILSEPFIGVDVVKTEAGEFVVKSIEPAGQGVAKGIQPGDRIVLVDGKVAGQYRNLVKYNTIEMADSVLIEHSTGERQEIVFTDDWQGGHSTWQKLLQLYIPLTSIVLFFSISIFLYMKRKNDRAALLLMLFFVAIGLAYFASAASYRSEPVGLTVICLLMPNIPIIFVLFMNRYLERFSVIFISKRSLVPWVIVCEVVSAANFIHIWTDLFTREQFVIIMNVFYGTILIGHFLVIIQLVRRFLYYRHSKHRSLFKITLFSHLVAFTPFALLNLLPSFAGTGQLLPAAFTSLFLFILPIVYFYLLTSNQLFDIDFIVTRFKYYTLLSFIPSLFIMIVVMLLLKGKDFDADWYTYVAVFIVIYAVMALFLYAKEQIDHHYRPRLFKAMYSYQDSLDRYSRKIARVMKQSDLEDVLQQEIHELLPVNKVVFLLVDKEEMAVYPSHNHEDDFVTGQFLLASADSLQIGELIDLPHGLGLVIGRQRSRFHVLWIGNKTNHTRYNSDELRWLKTMGNYTSIVFENLYLIEGLTQDLEAELGKEHTASAWVLRLLFCLSENERRKLAADLHDSALQDQLIWYRKLEAVLMDYPMNERLGNELNEIKEGLLDVIHQIRETCNELRPPLLKEMGVVEAIESIIEHTQMRVNFAVDFRATSHTMPLNEEQITAIYRIVQELLRNADKHSKAKLVRLELEQRNDNIYFRYEDDGIGLDVNSMNASFEHMGLSGIKERVLSMEGEISFNSRRGKGLEIIIIIPLVMTSGYTERGLLRDSYLIS